MRIRWRSLYGITHDVHAKDKNKVCKFDQALYCLRKFPDTGFQNFIVFFWIVVLCNQNQTILYSHPKKGSLFYFVYLDDAILASDDEYLAFQLTYFDS